MDMNPCRGRTPLVKSKATLWSGSSESDGSEIESKSGFEEHHNQWRSTMGFSGWIRDAALYCTPRCPSGLSVLTNGMATVALVCVCLVLQVGNLDGLDRVDGSDATCVGGLGPEY